MNGDDDEDLRPENASKLLAGHSLLQIHVNAGKILPKDGLKDFSPTNSWMEKKQVQSALDERKELLGEERVEKWGCLATAIWDNKKKLAEVTRRTGKHFQTLGFEKEGTLFLYPEEALYLLEMKSLELIFGGVPVSIQQGYSLLLGSNSGCSLIEYRTYSHLLRQGYRLLRFTSQKLHTRYERTIRLDQHATAKRSHPGKVTVNKSCDVKKSISVKDDVRSRRGSSRESCPSLVKEENEDYQSCSYEVAVKTPASCSSEQPEAGTCFLEKKQQECNEHPVVDRKALCQENMCSALHLADCIGTTKNSNEKNVTAVEECDGHGKDHEVHNEQQSTSETRASQEEVAANNDDVEQNLPENTKGREGSGAISKECDGHGKEHEVDNEQQSTSETRASQEEFAANNDDVEQNLPENRKERKGSGASSEECDGHGKDNEADNEQQSTSERRASQEEVAPNNDDVEQNLPENTKEREGFGAISEVVNSQDNHSVCDIENAKSKAYGIAEGLLSLGNILVVNDSKGDNSCSESRAKDLSSILQSEIIKVLGTHLQADVSQEALSTVAFSAASTILSHLSVSKDKTSESGQDNKSNDHEIQYNEKTLSDVDDTIDISENSDDKCTYNMINEEDDEMPVALTAANILPMDQTLTCDSMDCFSKSVLQNASKESERVVNSQDVKRPASSLSDNDCETLLIKRPKMANITDPDVEIIEVVPEEKHVELVNLSDESSNDSEDHCKAHDDDNDSIEVIDVHDSSSSESTDTESSSSDCNSSVIVEDRSNGCWEAERKHILESIPNMYNLSEISLSPPSSDLLPDNVKPQRNHYVISRGRLQRESKETPSIPHVQFPMHRQPFIQPQINFDLGQRAIPTGQVWQPNVPINPITAVQAVAQLVLPMLGFPPNAFPSNQMWMPRNTWFPPRPMWGRGRGRGPQHSNRGNVWRGPYRPRPYGFRHFTPRFNPLPRDSNRDHHEVTRNSESGPSMEQREKMIVNAPEGQNQWHSWRQRGRGARKKGEKKKKYFRNRYFGEGKVRKEDYDDVNVHPDGSLLTRQTTESPNLKPESDSCDEDIEVNSSLSVQRGKRHRVTRRSTRGKKMCLKKGGNGIKRESIDDGNSLICDTIKISSIKPESDSSDEHSTGHEREFIHNDSSRSSLQESSESTDYSCGSPSEAKPLLSPNDCSDFASVFKALQVIKQADTPTLVSNIYGNLKPQFDLFYPSTPFKKGNPPQPDFHLCIMSCDDSVPVPGEIRMLSDSLDDSVPIMFAIVSPDSISFIQFCDISLPAVPLTTSG